MVYHNLLLVSTYDNGEAKAYRFSRKIDFQRTIVLEMEEEGGLDEFSVVDSQGLPDIENYTKFVSANGKLDCYLIKIPKNNDHTYCTGIV